MVRTYTWNPSTQSSLQIIGNFNNGDEKKTVTSLLPTSSTNLYSTQCFSNTSIYKPNCKNGQITNISTTVPKDGTQNDTTGSSSEVFSAGNNYIQCPLHMLHSQTASLWQPRHQSFPIYYPILPDFPANPYHWRSHLFPSQITAPIVLEQTTNFRPANPWYLRPIQIGSKVYYEPVNSSSAPCNSPTSIVPHTVASANLVSIPNNARFQNASLSYLPGTTTIPMSVDKINKQNKFLHSEAAGINHSTTSSNNGSLNLPWTFGTPQLNSGICGIPSCQTPLLVTKESLIFDREANESSTVSAFRNTQCQASPSHQLHGSLYQHSLSHTITPSQQHQCYRKMTAIDSTEQYKRDLQLQIEQNRHRKEEERQRELEIERKEMIKFEEYRRKVQQEIEEEERKEKEKILAVQRRAARMRALQEEAALKVRREAKNRTGRNVCRSVEGTKTEERTSSTAEPNHLEWWEKKKEHVNNNAKRPTYSPVIPTLRKKDGISADLSRNTAFEISANNNKSASSCVPYDRFNKSHSSSRLSRRSYHSSLTSGRNSSLDLARLHRKSSHTHQQNESLLSKSLRKDNESEVKCEARSSRIL
ncbi:unnamed protein product [Cercopithifilaria johnstoni]|uniref:Uncharacterized protein n=1 Tax=Cercopithifilaria johnstoni TaxID=2874296 RepID=A0A8J2MCT2_9BILA|nr:unnamed protein product [Cercopithifilaria johnstoni]